MLKCKFDVLFLMFLLSTNDTTIELVDEITKTIENNEFTVGIFLD